MPRSNAVVWIEDARAANCARPHCAGVETIPPRVAIVSRPERSSSRTTTVVHNVFFGLDSESTSNSDYRSVASRAALREPGLVRVDCNIHPQMVGFVMVVDTPFAALTDRDGAFRFDGIPAGTWTLKAWHEEGTETSIPLTVPLAGNAPLTISIDTTTFKPVPHRNKYGKEYPPQSGSEDERY